MVHRQAQNMILLHISLPLSTNPIANIDSKLDFESNHANINLSWIILCKKLKEVKTSMIYFVKNID
jgi:hypothetical protein